MNEFLIMLIIFVLLFVVAYFSFRYLNSDKHSTLNIVIYMLAGILVIRLSMSTSVLPSTIMVLYSIPLALFKVRNNGGK